MRKIKSLGANETLYLSVVDTLERDIRSGSLKAGDRLPASRVLAQKLGISCATASRAYAEAESRGLIAAVVGRGTFVTADACRNASVLDAQLNAAPFEMGLVRPLSMCDGNLLPIVDRLLRADDFRRCMRYSEPRGLPEHRRVGADWIRRFGPDAKPDSVILTAGAQHAVTSFLFPVQARRQGRRAFFDISGTQTGAAAGRAAYGRGGRHP